MQRVEITEAKKISDSIEAIFKYPHALNNILFYINEETANLLAASGHTLLKEWGEKCQAFYADDPMKKFVEPTSGLTVVKRDGINLTGMLICQGNWNWLNKSWEIAPGYYSCSSNWGANVTTFNSILSGGIAFGSWHLPAINPPNISTSPFKLISPMHVAALIGDVELIKRLIEKGARLEDEDNDWHITPLELAILSKQKEVIAFMMQQNINLDNAFKIMIEKASPSIIQFMTKDHFFFTDQVMEAAKTRSVELHSHLTLKKEQKLREMIDEEGALKILQFLLNATHISNQNIVDLLAQYPKVVCAIPNESDGNTLLHQLIIDAKDAVKVKAYLSAIFQAGKKVRPYFDIEKTNKADKTVLKLALTNRNKDVIAAVILYGNPSLTGSEAEIHALNINIAAINQEHRELMLKLMQETADVSIKHNDILTDTSGNVAALAEEMREMQMALRRTQEALMLMQKMFVTSQDENLFYRSTLLAICGRLGMTLPTLPAPPSMPALPFDAARNHALLFAPSGTTSESPAPASHTL